MVTILWLRKKTFTTCNNETIIHKNLQNLKEVFDLV